MVVLFLFLSLVLFVLADLGIRAVMKRVRDQRARRERAEALMVSLRLDVSREAPSLKRAEVKDAAARILCVDDEPVILDSFRKPMQCVCWANRWNANTGCSTCCSARAASAAR